MSDEYPAPNAAAETDSAAIWAFAIAAVFAVLAGFLVFGAWTKLGFPFLFGDLAIASFGRLWPMASLTLVLGAITFLHVGALAFLLPRLTGVTHRLPLGRFGPLASGLLVGTAILSVGLGFGDGRHGFESPLLGDLAILVALAGPAAIALRSLFAKREATIYPSLWFLIGGLLSAMLAVAVANFPLTEATGSLVQTGFGRATILWGWAVAGGVGSAFFLVPRITGQALFSRPLAIATFISLLLPGMFYGLSTHLFGPVPEWAEAIGIGMRFSLLVPALLIPVGLLASGEGALDLLRTSPVLRLVAAGTSLVSIAGVVTAVSGFRSTQSVIGLTTFDLGTETLLLAGSLLLGTAMAFHAFPRLVGRSLPEGDGPDWHLRLTVVGAVAGAGFLWLAGVTSGVTWRAGATSGAFANHGEGFAQTLDAVSWMYQMLPLAGLVFLAGQVLFARTLWSTWTTGRVEAVESVTEVAR